MRWQIRKGRWSRKPVSGSYCHITNHPKLSGFKQHSFIIPHEFTAKLGSWADLSRCHSCVCGQRVGRPQAGGWMTGLPPHTSSFLIVGACSHGGGSGPGESWCLSHVLWNTCRVFKLHPTRQSKSCAQAQCQRGRDKKVGAKGVDTDREDFNREHC